MDSNQSITKYWPHPPHVGIAWWSVDDNAIGSGSHESGYLQSFWFQIQIRIRDGIITDTQCRFSDSEAHTDEMLRVERSFSQAVARFLTGKAIKDTMGYPDRDHGLLVDITVSNALLDWAQKMPGRQAELPPAIMLPPPKPLPPKGFCARLAALLRSIGL